MSNTYRLLDRASELFSQENKLIEIKSDRVVFVGDTHGDIEATRKIIENYMDSGNTIVFLGDYVDRGPFSKENIDFLLETKLEYPDRLFMLMGNHEGRPFLEFYPADFWVRLDPESYEQYATVFSSLPLAATTPNGIIALHGALPSIGNITDFNSIELGGERWRQITWGDWQEEEGINTDIGRLISRPRFDKSWFEETMSKLKKNVLIRSHQPNARQVIFDGRCLTIFTSLAYHSMVSERTIAIADLSQEVRTVDDLILEKI